MGYCSGRGRVRKRCFCEKEKVHCKFANACTYCDWYEGYGLCSKDYHLGNNDDWTKCKSNKQKCFQCEYLHSKDENGHCLITHDKQYSITRGILFD